MRVWYFYDLATGLFDGRRFSSSDSDALSINIPEGMGAFEGAVDYESQRVTFEDIDGITFALLTDYQPPRPDALHYWDTQTKRWRLNDHEAYRRAKILEIEAAIKDVDARLIRPVVELQINPEDAEARQIRDTLVVKKNKLRAELQTLRETV